MLRLQYLHTTIEQMQEAWEDILLEMDSKLQKFAEEKNVSLLFLQLVPPSGVSAMVIDSSSPSPSVIRHLSFKSHHFWVSVHSIHPSCPRSSFFFSGWFRVYYLPAGLFLFLGGFICIICMQACSSGCLRTCQNHLSRLSVTLIRTFATPTARHMYSFFILSFRVAPHIHLNIFKRESRSQRKPIYKRWPLFGGSLYSIVAF